MIERPPCHPVGTLSGAVSGDVAELVVGSATLSASLTGGRLTGVANEEMHRQSGKVECVDDLPGCSAEEPEKVREHCRRALAALLQFSPGVELVFRRHGFYRTIHAVVDGNVVCRGRIKLEERSTDVAQLAADIEGTEPRHVRFCQRCVQVAVDAQTPSVEDQDPRAITASTRAHVFERDNFRCRRCGWTVDDGVKLVIDHIVPVSKGGSGAITNLQTLCGDCNAGKSARDPHPHDFIQ